MFSDRRSAYCGVFDDPGFWVRRDGWFGADLLADRMGVLEAGKGCCLWSVLADERADNTWRRGSRMARIMHETCSGGREGMGVALCAISTG